MSELSAYEKERLKNIADNQAKLFELGLVGGPKLCDDVKKEEKTKTKKEESEEIPLPTREKSPRIAGQGEKSYADFFSTTYDEIERSERMLKRKKRASADLGSKTRDVKTRDAGSRMHPQDDDDDEPLPSVPASETEMDKLFRLRFTSQHLYDANYPLDFQITYQAYEEANKSNRPKDFKPHKYQLAQPTGYRSNNPRAICPECKYAFVLNWKGKMRKHGSCEVHLI